MSIELVMPFNHVILCCPLFLPPSIFPSIRVFSSESVLCITWPKYWSFSFSISPSNKYSGLISFRMDWFRLFAVQGTLKSFLNTTVQKHHFFGAQLSFFFFSVFIYLFIFFPGFFFFLFVVNFVIHGNETAMGLHVFPIPIPPPTSLSTRSL